MSSKIEEIVHRAYVSKPKYAESMPGVPEDYAQIKTLADLLKINYKPIPVQNQLRANLIYKLKNGLHPYQGIVGYEEDVIPSINRAVLAGHDLLFVGQIGQAKTKLSESIAENLLSPIPVVHGTVTNDVPTSIPEEQLVAMISDKEVYHTTPEFIVSTECEDIIRNNGLETRIDWIEGKDRYRYVLATPDISVKDLVGQIDAIKIAKKGVDLYSVDSYSPGQLLQANHGILCIDELPVLDPRKQVALLSVLQEGKFTTGSYPVTFRPDVKIIATANPIDYTHSGKIIEPLFDRLKSHIHTHYPTDVLQEMLIVAQESKIADLGNVFLPVFMLKLVAKISQLARSHNDVNHDKGVSVRMAVHSMELLVGEAERARSISTNVKAVPRFCDIYSIGQSSKFELSEMDDTLKNRTNVLNSIIENALREVSQEYIQKISPEHLIKVKGEFAKNKSFEVSQGTPGSKDHQSGNYESRLAKYSALKQVVQEVANIVREEQKVFVQKAGDLGIKTSSISPQDLDGEFTASVTEVVLEGLRWTQPPLLDKKDNVYGVA